MSLNRMTFLKVYQNKLDGIDDSSETEQKVFGH